MTQSLRNLHSRFPFRIQRCTGSTFLWAKMIRKDFLRLRLTIQKLVILRAYCASRRCHLSISNTSSNLTHSARQARLSGCEALTRSPSLRRTLFATFLAGVAERDRLLDCLHAVLGSM